MARGQKVGGDDVPEGAGEEGRHGGSSPSGTRQSLHVKQRTFLNWIDAPTAGAAAMAPETGGASTDPSRRRPATERRSPPYPWPASEALTLIVCQSPHLRHPGRVAASHAADMDTPREASWQRRTWLVPSRPRVHAAARSGSASAHIPPPTRLTGATRPSSIRLCTSPDLVGQALPALPCWLLLGRGQPVVVLRSMLLTRCSVLAVPPELMNA